MKQKRTSWIGVKIGLLFALTALTMGSSGGCPRDLSQQWDWWAVWFAPSLYGLGR